MLVCSRNIAIDFFRGHGVLYETLPYNKVSVEFVDIFKGLGVIGQMCEESNIEEHL